MLLLWFTGCYFEHNQTGSIYLWYGGAASIFHESPADTVVELMDENVAKVTPPPPPVTKKPATGLRFGEKRIQDIKAFR